MNSGTFCEVIQVYAKFVVFELDFVDSHGVLLGATLQNAVVL